VGFPQCREARSLGRVRARHLQPTVVCVALGALVWGAAPADARAQAYVPSRTYVVPPAAQPGYAPAYSPQPAGPPYVVHDWNPDVPPPEGYDLRTSANGKLIGFGVAMLSIGYVTSAVVGLVAIPSVSSSKSDGWAPLFVPVGGPFAAIGTLGASSAETGLLVADGVLQAGGLLAIIVGATETRHRVVRTQFGAREPSPVELIPTVGVHGSGLTARFTF